MIGQIKTNRLCRTIGCLAFLFWGHYAHSNDVKTLVDAAELEEIELPSFSATHVNWHEPSGQEVMTAAIDLSPAGLRVRQKGSNSHHEILQDFKGERGWFIDHERSVSHILELVAEPELVESAPGNRASFLGSKPCGMLKAEIQGPGLWRGRRVTAYHCLEESNDEVLAVEFVDSIYQIVVYRRTSTGFIDELRGFVERSFHASYFTPPSKYRTIDKDEFFFGAPKLNTYSNIVEKHNR